MQHLDRLVEYLGRTLAQADEAIGVPEYLNIFERMRADLSEFKFRSSNGDDFTPLEWAAYVTRPADAVPRVTAVPVPAPVPEPESVSVAPVVEEDELDIEDAIATEEEDDESTG